MKLLSEHHDNFHDYRLADQMLEEESEAFYHVFMQHEIKRTIHSRILLARAASDA